MEYYFGDENYPKDDYMHKIQDANGYIYINDILNFSRMKYFNATEVDIIEISAYTDSFELDPLKIKMRRKERSLNLDLKILGFDI